MKIHYRDLYPDNERTIVLLHGLGVDSSCWYYQEEALGRAGYRPVIPDIPGFGGSEWVKGRWNIKEASKVLAEWIDGFSSGPKVIAGISLGGVIAQHLMALTPGRYVAGILISAFMRIRPENPENLVYMLSRGLKVVFRPFREQADYMAGKLFPNDNEDFLRRMIIEQITKTDPAIYRQAMLALALVNSEKLASRISIPCLLISGSDDSTIPLANQKKLAGSLAHCDHTVIKGAGHGVIVEKPDEVNRRILEFLAKNWN